MTVAEYGSRLELVAAERRATMRALEVDCPDPSHFWARRDVPCGPPVSAHPFGTICIERRATEIETREERAAAAAVEANRQRREANAEWARERAERRQKRSRVEAAARMADAAGRGREDQP